MLVQKWQIDIHFQTVCLESYFFCQIFYDITECNIIQTLSPKAVVEPFRRALKILKEVSRVH